MHHKHLPKLDSLKKMFIFNQDWSIKNKKWIVRITDTQSLISLKWFPKIHCKWTEIDIGCQWHLPDKPTKPLAVLAPDLRFMMKECNGVVL